MNPDRHERDELAEELAGSLPAPVERDFAPGRAQILKEHLMSEIRTDAPSPAVSPEPAAPRRRWRRAVLVPTFVAVTAAAAATAVVATHHGSAGGPAQPTGPAVALLAKVATAANRQPAPTVRDDQYEYVASTERAADAPGGETIIATPGAGTITGPNGGVVATELQAIGSTPAPLGPPLLVQVWRPAANLCLPGLSRYGGQDSQFIGVDPATGPCPNIGDLNASTYRLLAGLPTDPRALLNRIYTEEKGHPDLDGEAFTTIGDLLQDSVVPPAVSAALYRAAALIPGVRVIDDATDALGRHGVAVARDLGDVRTEWIFDRTSLLQIGKREVYIPTGAVTESSAIQDKAIVNHIGDTK